MRHVGSLHFLIYFVAIYIGSLSLYEEKGGGNDTFIWSVMAYPILALVGMLIARAVVPRGPFRVMVSNLSSAPIERRITYQLLTFFSILLGVYLVLLGSRIPLYVQITQGVEAAQVARFLATKGYKEAFGDIGLIVNFSRVFTDYFALFLLIFEYCRARTREIGYWRLIVMALSLGFAAILFGERYPILKLITYFAFAIIVLRYKVFTFKLLLSLVFCGALVIPLVGLVHALTNLRVELLEVLSVDDVIALFGWSWQVFSDRAFIGQLLPLYQTFDQIPGTYDFFGGRTLSNPRQIFPYEQVNLPFLIYDTYLDSGSEIQGSDPTVFFAEVYANFGSFVSFTVMILAGFVMQIVDSVLSQKIDARYSIYFVALHFMIMVYIADFAISFTTIYFDYRFFFLLLLYFLPGFTVLLKRKFQPPASA